MQLFPDGSFEDASRDETEDTIEEVTLDDDDQCEATPEQLRVSDPAN